MCLLLERSLSCLDGIERPPQATAYLRPRCQVCSAFALVLAPTLTPGFRVRPRSGYCAALLLETNSRREKLEVLLGETLERAKKKPHRLGQGYLMLMWNSYRMGSIQARIR